MFLHTHTAVLSVMSAIALLHPALARASDDNDSGLRVIIDNSRIESAPGDVDNSLTSSVHTVIPAERFRQRFVSLEQVLEQEVGVQTRSTGGEGSLAMTVLRAASSEQVVIYLDGVPLNEAAGGVVDLGMVPLDLVERIDIYRGSTPVELSSPSIGGAVNIITRQGRRDSRQQWQATLASFSTAKLAYTAENTGKQNDLLFTTSLLKSDNDFRFRNDNGTPLNDADDRVETRNNDAVEQATALFSWKRRIDADSSSLLRLDLTRRDKQLPAVNNNADVQTFIDTRQLNLLAQFNQRRFITPAFNSSIRLFGSDKREIFDDSLAQLGFINQRTDSRSRKLGGRMFVEHASDNMQWKWIGAASAERYDTDSSLAVAKSGTNRRAQTELSAENVAYFNQQRLIVSTVLRYQQTRDSIATRTDAFANVIPGFDKRTRLLNAQLGFKYRYSRDTFWQANIGQYARTPSFVELFGGSGLLLGNVDLAPEQSVNADAGLQYRWYRPYHWLHDAKAWAGVFHNRVDNLIVYLYNAQGVGVPENIADATVQGVELSFELSPRLRHGIRASYTWTDSINRSAITSFDGKQLPGYYRNSLGLKYAYQNGRWTTSVEADIKRDMFYDRSNLLAGDDVNRINASVRYQSGQGSVELAVNNVLGETVQYFRNRPTPGRSVSLTASVMF